MKKRHPPQGIPHKKSSHTSERPSLHHCPNALAPQLSIVQTAQKTMLFFHCLPRVLTHREQKRVLQCTKLALPVEWSSNCFDMEMTASKVNNKCCRAGGCALRTRSSFAPAPPQIYGASVGTTAGGTCPSGLRALVRAACTKTTRRLRITEQHDNQCREQWNRDIKAGMILQSEASGHFGHFWEVGYTTVRMIN